MTQQMVLTAMTGPYGGAGFDLINGDSGNDTLYGGADEDTPGWR